MATQRGSSFSTKSLLAAVLVLALVHESFAQNCLQKNNISVGWLPDQDDGVLITAITDIIGQPACYYGLYSQIESTTYDDSQLTGRMDDIKSSGAILEAAVMPTKVRFADISTDLASQIATSMKKFTDNGITVWLRFAHEMNYYVTDGTYAGGTGAEFIQAWKNVQAAVSGNPDVKMFWCPNVPNGDGSDPIDQYWPGPDVVDIVGIDYYPQDTVPTFSDAYGDFINTYAAPNGKIFAIAETGTTVEGSKSGWLTAISSADAKSAFPSYAGFAWFEYLKDGADFRVVTGNTNYASPILTGS